MDCEKGIVMKSVIELWLGAYFTIALCAFACMIVSVSDIIGIHFDAF